VKADSEWCMKLVDSSGAVTKLEGMKPVRLQKYMAQAGVGSRRHCEELIAAGRVSVNNKRAELGMSVVPGVDRVVMRNREIRPEAEHVVIAVNKPTGVLSACHRGKEEGFLITEVVKTEYRLFPVGRLDRDSEGLLLLTNDGDLALRLTHPRYGNEKEYEVEFNRPVSPDLCGKLLAGVELEDGPARAVACRQTAEKRISLVLAEGRKREVRRMLARLGWGIVRLRRVRIAGLRLGSLKPGEWRRLPVEEVTTKLLGGTQ
jgi:23S rRNA pseudouridine2605 synthase